MVGPKGSGSHSRYSPVPSPRGPGIRNRGRDHDLFSLIYDLFMLTPGPGGTEGGGRTLGVPSPPSNLPPDRQSGKVGDWVVTEGPVLWSRPGRTRNPVSPPRPECGCRGGVTQNRTPSLSSREKEGRFRLRGHGSFPSALSLQ